MRTSSMSTVDLHFFLRRGRYVRMMAEKRASFW